ncbi:hypothetical protein E2C01_013315 [Portunus trituberculatus]|uniref:Uncharacterized protein n=1 Tax=Portunus trituberculatus TaxID=210409 RepID=A0A5B7DFV5_PORTR|nr:hypothetical protein [Portunus trituberculatus]
MKSARSVLMDVCITYKQCHGDGSEREVRAGRVSGGLTLMVASSILARQPVPIVTASVPSREAPAAPRCLESPPRVHSAGKNSSISIPGGTVFGVSGSRLPRRRCVRAALPHLGRDSGPCGRLDRQ